MPESLYEQRLALFQFALIGRLILPQGAAPRTTDSLKGELKSAFNSIGEWFLLPLGKGFFSLNFQLQEDQFKAKRQSSWKLSTGSLFIRDWKPNFDPYQELSSTAQVWVRLFHLPLEYWHPEFLVGIFRAVGNVIKLDGNTAQGLVGHFARALVEVDLTSPIINTVLVGLPNNLFSVDFSYENIPLLCTFCNFIGHSVDSCRKAKVGTADKKMGTENGPKAKPPAKPTQHGDTKPPARNKQIWVEKADGEQTQPKQQHFVDNTARPETDNVVSSNSFVALQDLEEEEVVSETQQTPGDFLDLATVNSDEPQQQNHLCEDLKARLLADAKSLKMNRQLRLEQESAAVPAATPEAYVTDASLTEGEEGNVVEQVPACATAIPQAAEDSTPPHKLPDANTISPTPSVSSDLRTSEGFYDDQPSSAAPTAVPATVEDSTPPAAVPAGKEGHTATASAQLDNTAVDSPPAQVKGRARRSKNKRTAADLLPKRQLRSSMKNRSTSEITPEMIQAYANNQCHYVPTDFHGKSKAKQVAPNSPHPKHLEEKLRTAAELGRHSTAYVLDTGQTGDLKSMDFITRQQWDAIPNTDAHTNSDFNSV